MDVLTDVLNVLELKGWISARNELTPPWRYNFAASRDMIFHLLGSGGSGYLSLEGDRTPLRVEEGAVLLLSITQRQPSFPQELHRDYARGQSGGRMSKSGKHFLEKPLPIRYTFPKPVNCISE